MVPAETWTPPPSSDDANSTNGTTSGTTNGGTSGTPTDGDAGAGGNLSGNGASGGAGGKPTGNTVPEKVGGDTSSGSATPAANAPAPPTVSKGTGPKVTKAECKKVLDKYLDLAIANDPNLQGLPPDVIKQAFAQAAQQSASPCDGDGVTRNQYKCAMKATSTDKWQACMK